MRRRLQLQIAAHQVLNKRQPSSHDTALPCCCLRGCSDRIAGCQLLPLVLLWVNWRLQLFTYSGEQLPEALVLQQQPACEDVSIHVICGLLRCGLLRLGSILFPVLPCWLDLACSRLLRWRC
jgi:hypothetical protein